MHRERKALELVPFVNHAFDAMLAGREIMLLGELQHRLNRPVSLCLVVAIARESFFHQPTNVRFESDATSLNLGGKLVGNGERDLHDSRLAKRTENRTGRLHDPLGCRSSSDGR